MKTVIFKSLSIIIAGLIMSFLFSGESMGLNTFLFTISFLGLSISQNPTLFKNKPNLIIAAGTLLASILVVWHHSLLAKTTYVLSFILFIGMVQQRSIRFLWYGFLLGMGSLLTAPISIVQNMGSGLKGGWKNLYRWAQLILLPLILGLIFFWIYYQAVPGFGNISDRFGNWIGTFLEWENPGPAFWLFLFGMVISGSLLWKSLLASFFQKREEQFGFKLLRKKKTKIFNSFPVLGLKKEYIVAIICISVLNGLLLLVNISQLSALIQEQFKSRANELSQSLHASTELLTLSIIMAMGVLLFFFRRNLNFFPNNQILKVLAYTWLVQNGLLALMTLFQDVIYIIHYGMAYYRLWLAFFLLLVCFGLVSIYIKIAQKKSIFYLFSINAWSIYLTLILVSCLNWDLLITRFNIFHAQNEQVDLYFLFNLSDKNTYILEENKDYIFSERQPYYVDQEYFDQRIKARCIRLTNRWEDHSWKSWNWVGWKNQRILPD